MNDLIVLENVNLPQAFANGQIDPLIAEIEKQARSFLPDISTVQGRKDIASLAHKIAKSKTALDAAGKELVSGWKEQSKKVDAERARVWDKLEALQKEIRAPLTEWETAEKDRVAAHEAALMEMAEQSNMPVEITLVEIERRIARCIEISGSRSWEEFATRAKSLHTQIYDSLLARLERRKTWEAEQAELERLRKEEAARKQKEHEERIAMEAAQTARLAAEEKARKDAEAAAAKAKAEQDRIERERQEAVARAKKAEDDAKAAKKKADADRIAAEEKAKRDVESAELREREKIEAEKKAEAQALKKREDDKNHRAKINYEAVQGVMLAMGEEHSGNDAEAKAIAKDIVVAIAKGLVPHIRIHY